MIPLLLTLSLLIAVVGAALWASGGKTVHEEQGVGTVEAMPGSLSESSAAPCTALTLFSYDLGYGLGGTRLGAAQASEAVYDRLDRVVEGGRSFRGGRRTAAGGRFCQRPNGLHPPTALCGRGPGLGIRGHNHDLGVSVSAMAPFASRPRARRAGNHQSATVGAQ